MTDLSSLAPTTLFARVRQVTAMLAEDKPDGQIDQVDRTLAALALLAGACIIIWPEAKAMPKIVTKVSIIGRALWARRSWWLPAATPSR